MHSASIIRLDHGNVSFALASVLLFIPLLHRCAEKKYPEELPTISVVLIYLNEALSIIQRAIRSIIDRTPAELLVEIILVDDHSTNGG